MKKTSFSVGQLAKQAKCKVETVHFYERSALMPEPPRTEGGHRVYDIDHVKRLNFIRRSRELGFSVEQVRALLKFIDEPNHCCGEVKSMAAIQVDAVQKKIDDLQRLKQALNEMIGQCKGNDYAIEDCPIVDSLYVETR